MSYKHVNDLYYQKGRASLMNILRMRYFIDVAKFENITKAAQINYISQTAMSQQIANIEHELEIKLFTRNKGHLHLTDAGYSFYKDCMHILKDYDSAVRHAQNIWNHQFGQGELYLGILGSSTFSYLDDILVSFNDKYPNINVKLVQVSFASMRNDLEQGNLDLAICPSFNFSGLANINCMDLYDDKMGFLVPITHPLARKDSVYISDIIHEKIIMTDAAWAGMAYEKMLDSRRKVGYEPIISETAASAIIHRTLVAFGRGCAFLPEHMGIYDNRKCKMLHIIDDPDVQTTSLAWQKNTNSPPLLYLVTLIQNFFRDEFKDWLEEYLEFQKENEII